MIIHISYKIIIKLQLRQWDNSRRGYREISADQREKEARKKGKMEKKRSKIEKKEGGKLKKEGGKVKNEEKTLFLCFLFTFQNH